MMKFLTSNKAPQAIGPYTQAIRWGNFIFCSGQIGLDPATGELREGIEAQTEQILKNLAEVLRVAGTNLDQVVKTTIFLKDINDFSKVNEIYAREFLSHKPARSTVEVSHLPKNSLIEIEAIAIIE